MQLIETKFPGFRPGTKVPAIRLNFLFKNSGIGDYLNFTTAVKYSLDTYDYISTNLLVSQYFAESFELIFKDYIADNRVTVQVLEKLTQAELGSIMINSSAHNPNGMHLIDCGFRSYANLDAPPDATLPCIEEQLKSVENPVSKLHRGRYAVLPLGATVETRKMSVAAANGVIDELRRRGIVPVFLGKREMTGRHKASFDEGYRLDLGINLIDETDLVQAAKIMSEASAVIGIDGGLLHLAAMTKAPIIFGYTVASPEHRHPRRLSKYTTLKVVPDEDKVPCRFCQSRVRFVRDMTAKVCTYGDNLCVHNLDAAKWLNAMDFLFRVHSGG